MLAQGMVRQDLKCAHKVRAEKREPATAYRHSGWASTVLVDDEISQRAYLVDGLGFAPAVHAAPSLPDTAVFSTPSLLAGRHPLIAIRHSLIAILTLLRTGAAIFSFSSVGF